ncbi:MAG: putative 60 kDa inner membrane insertion protein [Parcubacteria group bacterium Gr01-1014_70]|nr:MAG: putative 60 kDa inner membrane insertion protein [Parcubacteria group bacterium Gr01-1014_70]
MSFFTTIFNEIFFRPLLNALVFFTDILPFHDLGFAVIILTIVVRLILFPFTHHSIKAQTKMRTLEPEIARIRNEHKDNQEEQARRIMALYKQHGVNPLSGCVMLLIQLPLLIALYRVFLVGVGDVGVHLYSFVSTPESLRTVFLGTINLTEVSIFLAALSGLTQFIQMKLAIPTQAAPRIANAQKPDIARMMTAQMTYVMPGVIFIIGLQFPAAVSLYWTTMNIFAIIHEMIVRKKAEGIRTAYEPGRDLKNI